MRFVQRIAPFALLLVLSGLSGAALGQGATPVDVENALKDLKEAPPYERSESRQAVVELGDVAVDPLIAEVSTLSEAADANYIVQCIIALGELKAESGTDALLQALMSRNYQQVYAAAEALGLIWEGKGAAGSDAVKTVNGALLALLYSDMPDEAVFGPGQALIRINGIASIDRPTSMTADGLKQALSAWANGHADALPPLDEQPWQLGVRIALTTSDAAQRADALQAVRQKRALGALQPLLQALAANSGLSAQVRQNVGQLVADLSNVEFPTPGTKNEEPSAQVDAWKVVWLRELRQRKDDKHIEYSWRELEDALRDYEESPSDETAEAVKYFRAALLSQLDGPDQIPATASAEVRALLEDTLTAKAEIAKAVGAIQAAVAEGDQVYEVSRQLAIIKEELRRNERSVEVGRMYAQPIVTLAYAETNKKLAEPMGEILSEVTGIPVDLGFASIDDRRRRLGNWVDQVKRILGIDLKLPEGA